ncbi:MAG: cytochrome c biogenesis heme-transporting ATPase CcmA [Betaproteobacteria bacterium]
MLSVSDLSCVRGDQTLFSGVNFNLNAGQWLHLEGSNGSGKTSLLRIVSGFTPPAQGQVRWRGQPLAQAVDAFHAELLYLGHALALKEELTAIENLQADAAIARRSFERSHAVSALQRLGLRGRTRLPVRVLSQGQKRRVALARLFLQNAPLWVLDEPFVALDVHAQALVADAISTHVQAGGMALFTSHQAMDLRGLGSSYRLDA